MAPPFDPGYCGEPFRTLCAEYPGPEAYPASDFRVEWGPIFHRGRLDGSARVLVIGQDPAQHETVVRRILVGEAGRRVQGFLAKLGITRNYVMINTFLYSVFGSVDAQTRRAPELVAYRHRWIAAFLTSPQLEAVLTLGVARYGTANLMNRLGPGGESIRVGSSNRQVFLAQATGDPDVGGLSLGTAVKTLTRAFRELPNLARELEKPKPVARVKAARILDRREPVVWTLALDELQETGVDLRPRLPFASRRVTGPGRPVIQAAKPLSAVIEPLTLDPLTVADDGDFFERIGQQRNLPAAVKKGLPGLY